LSDIVIFCVDSTAGVVNGLTEAVNKYTKYSCRFVRAKENWLNYPGDISIDDTDAVKEALTDCQAVHFNIYDHNAYNRMLNFDLTPFIYDKILTRHFHGSIVRRNDKLFKDSRYKKYFVSTPDLKQYCPEAVYLPNPIYLPEIHRIRYPDNWQIMHMPTNMYPVRRYLRSIKHPEFYPTDYPLDSCIKGTDLFIKAVEDLRDEGVDIEYVRPPKMPHAESIKWKADNCSAVFDQLYCGVYGMNSIEAMSMGKLAITRISDYALREMRNWDSEPVVIYNVDHTNINDKLRELTRESPKRMGKLAYDWAWKFHSPKRIAQRFVKELFE